jgi:hypothetical protein
MLDEAKLSELLARARELFHLTPVPPYDHPGMVTFERAEVLAREPASCTDDERRHLSECGRCARLLARFVREAAQNGPPPSNGSAIPNPAEKA